MKKQYILLILLLLFIAITNWVWLTLDTQPPWWDQADYLRTSLQYAHRLQKLDFSGFFSDLIFLNRTRPPLVMLLTTPVYFFNFRNEDLAVMINILFMGITFLVIFKLCKEYLDPRIALLSCFLLSMYPAIYGNLRTYLMDIGLMAIVSVSIYLLLKCDGFRNLKYSLLLGLSLGLGMLTKHSYVIFIAGPLVGIIWISGRIPSIHKEKNEISTLSKSRLNLLYCLIVGLGLTLSWYLPNFKQALGLILYNNSPRWARVFLPSYLINVKSFLTFLPRAMTSYGITSFFMLLFLCSSLLFFKDRRPHPVKKVLIWWIVLPFLVVTFYLNKQSRFLIPFFPALAIITAYGVYRIKNRGTRAALIGLIVVVGLFQFFFISFGPTLASSKSPHKVIGNRMVLFEIRQWQRPKREKWRLDDVLASLKKDAEREGQKQAIVVLLSDTEIYNANTLNYYSLKDSLGLHFFSAAWLNDVDSFMVKKNYLYAIYKDANAAKWKLYERRINQAYSYIKERHQEFRVIDKIRLFDGSNIVIYRRI